MPTNTSGGTTTSFSNTTQGNADSYTFTEEQLLADGTIYNRLTSTLFLDVMSNDLGGNAKSLYSIDDGGTGAMTDLLSSNVTTSWERTADGNWIRINAGKIEYRLDDGTNTLGSARDVNSLNEGEVISDTFVYAIRLGNGTLAMATVTINLTGTNDIATITGAAAGSVTEDGDGHATFQTASGTLTVVDPDSGQNELRPIAGTQGDNGHGTFVVNAGGTWSYTLNNGDADIQGLAQGETATDTITVTSEDGTDTQVITVTITGTNDVPTVSAVTSSADEDGAAVAGSFAGDDFDSDDDAASLTYAITSDPSEGSVTNNNDGTFSFDPGDAFQDLAEGETREVTFTYAATDGHGATSGGGTVTVTITGTNDVPTVSAVTSSADEDGIAVTASFAGDDVDSDDDAASLTYAITSDPSEGSVTNNNDGTFSFDPGDAFQDLAEGETREVTFTYAATDSHGATSGAGTVTVTVTGTNDAPAISIGTGDCATSDIDEADSALTASGQLTLSDVDTTDHVDVAVTGVGVGGTGSVDAVSVADLLAMLSLSGNVGNAADGTAGSLGWVFDSGSEAFDQLAEGETLVLTYTLTATDLHGGTDTQTVTVTITGTNDAAVIGGDLTGTAAEDGLGASGDASSTDVDNDNDAWIAAAGAGDDHYGSYTVDAAGKWTYTGDDSNGAVNALDDGDTLTDSFIIETVDGTTETVVVTITGSNDAPQLDHAIADQSVDEDHAVLFEVPADAFSDPDAGETLTYTATLEGGAALPGWLSFNSTTRTFSGTPPQDFNGVLSVAVTASDGDASVSDTFDLTINAVNDTPVNEITGYSTNEDTPTQLTGLSVGDVDAGTGEIQVTLSVASGTLSATSGGGLAISGSASGTIQLTGTAADINAYLAAATAPTFTPALNASGSVSLTMTTTDNGNSGSGGALTDTDQVTISVAAINDAAVITGDAAKLITEDVVPNTVSGNLDSTDVDGVNDSWLAQTLISANHYGSLAINGDGTWTYTLDNTNATVNALNTGSAPLMDSFTVQTADGTEQVITITINGANDGVTIAPVFNGTGDSNDNDTLLGSGSSSSPLITGTSAGETINGRTGSSQTADTINALGGADTVNAGDGGDTVFGGAGNDTIYGGAGNDALYGQAGDDAIYGEGNNDQLFGGTGDDFLDGGDNADALLAGGSGHDTLHGGLNGDTLVGGFGADDLYGEAGNDTFKFIDLRDTGDTIHDWNSGDKIDVSVIDANGIAAGDPAFAWGGTVATANGVWYSVSDGNATIYLDTDGNAATAELTITVLGVTSFTAGDFGL